MTVLLVAAALIEAAETAVGVGIAALLGVNIAQVGDGIGLAVRRNSLERLLEEGPEVFLARVLSERFLGASDCGHG